MKFFKYLPLITCLFASPLFATELYTTPVQQGLSNALDATGKWKRIFVSPGQEAQVKNDLGITTFNGGTITTATTINPSLTITGSSTSSADTAFKVQNSVNSPGLVVLNNSKTGIGTTTPQTEVSVVCGTTTDDISGVRLDHPLGRGGMQITDSGVLNIYSGSNTTRGSFFINKNGLVGNSITYSGSGNAGGFNGYIFKGYNSNCYLDFYRSALFYGIDFVWGTNISTQNAKIFNFKSLSASAGALTATGNRQTWFSVEPTINQSGTATYTALAVYATQTATGSTTNYLLDMGIGTTSKFSVTPSGTTTTESLLVTGNVGIGTTTPAAQLHTTGTLRHANFGAGAATFDANGNISSVSDERLKIIVGTFTAGLAELMGITPILHKYNKLSGLDMKNTYAGFSAQNVMQYIPEAVGQAPNGYYSLSDRPIVAALVNAVKELQKEIDALKGKTAMAITEYKITPIISKDRLVKSKPLPSPIPSPTAITTPTPIILPDETLIVYPSPITTPTP